MYMLDEENTSTLLSFILTSWNPIYSSSSDIGPVSRTASDAQKSVTNPLWAEITDDAAENYFWL